MPRLFEQTEDNNPNTANRVSFGRAGFATLNMTFVNFLAWLNTNLSFKKYNSAASGLPSTTGAGDIDMERVNDYYSETAITANVIWGLTNIVIDKTMSVDVKVASNTITLIESGITFKGAVDSGGVVQGLDSTKSNLLSLWAETGSVVWVTVIYNEA